MLKLLLGRHEPLPQLVVLPAPPPHLRGHPEEMTTSALLTHRSKPDVLHTQVWFHDSNVSHAASQSVPHLLPQLRHLCCLSRLLRRAGQPQTQVLVLPLPPRHLLTQALGLLSQTTQPHRQTPHSDSVANLTMEFQASRMSCSANLMLT